MVTHSSYLQTLEKSEAHAFISSLQKIKEHLSHELQWINAQVQQKTTQLEGVETLLSEVAALQSKGSNGTSAPEPSPELLAATSALEVVLPGEKSASALGDLSTVETNGNTPSQKSLDTNGASSSKSASASKSTSAQTKQSKSRKNDRSTSKSSKTSNRAPKTANAAQTKATETKKGTSSPKSKPSKSAQPKSKGIADTPATSNSTDTNDLRQFLRTRFRSKPMADAVAQFLGELNQPLTIEEVVQGLYSKLSGESYKRAKTAITNLLSVGKSKGLWQSAGRGKYVSNQGVGT